MPKSSYKDYLNKNLDQLDQPVGKVSISRDDQKRMAKRVQIMTAKEYSERQLKYKKETGFDLNKVVSDHGREQYR